MWVLARLGIDDPRKPIGVTADVAAQFAELGVKVTPTAAAEDDQVFEVWDMNWQAVRAFLALSTQWRTAVLSTLARARVVRLGLDYAAIEPTLRLLGMKRPRRIFEQLVLMEDEALSFEATLAR